MIKSIAGALLSVAIIFPIVQAPQPAHAVNCSVAGGQSGRLKYSGQVSQISATVCGNQIWKLLGKPKKPVKRVWTGKPRKYVNRFTVVPDRPNILGTTTLEVGQEVDFSALAIRHTRNRLLFWYPSQVRFAPKTFVWNFGDAIPGSGQLVRHAWSAKGNYPVRVVVGYAVKYRIIGHSSWVVLPGLVYSSSSPFLVTVGGASSTTSSKVVLVHWTCDEKPFALGC
jgi:hypothetical protein